MFPDAAGYFFAFFKIFENTNWLGCARPLAHETKSWFGGAALLVTVLEKKLLKTEIFSFESTFEPVLTTFGRNSLNWASKFDFGEVHLQDCPQGCPRPSQDPS